MAEDQKLEEILYYLIEKTNKVIRRYSQEKFVEAGISITVDQWLVLKKINETERITQIELAEALFKDRASITRILNLLEERNLIMKTEGEDKRANELCLTHSGKKFLDKAFQVVKKSRKKGIDNMDNQELSKLQASLRKIIKNLE